ncbi:cell division protein FtsA [Candidatus Woesebacteria bacterium]|nr:cell division protein FtsA [Candidatus Woesebacteria bacterium]
MTRNRIITAIDVGTDKCVTLIASVEEPNDTLRVMGVSAVHSRGMKRSQIIDLEQVLETITESLDGAERMAGVEVKSAFVSISGTHIASQNSKGVVAVASPNKEISPDDVERVIEAARAISLSSEREIIHVIPKDFKVDSQEGIKDPIGMTGVRLESEAHIVTGLSTSLKNMEKCILDLGLQVDGFVFSGLASASVVLSETEKELGVAVVDIGAGSTSLCVYVDGSLEYSASLPVGARHITQDIALGCKVSLDSAEKIKIALSKEAFTPLTPLAGESKQDFNKRKEKADQLKLTDFDQTTDTAESFSKKDIVEKIMLPRMQEIFALIGERLKSENLFPLIPAGIVIAGGGAQTTKIAEIAKRELNLSARIGKPVELQGLTNDITKPEFATSIGLLHLGRKQKNAGTTSNFSFGSIFKGLSLGSIPSKIGELFKSLMP